MCRPRPCQSSVAPVGRSLALPLAFVLGLGMVPGTFAEPSRAETCEPGSPASPVPSFLWPPTLEPAVPGQTLPARRDSTDYVSFGYPGYEDGHELYAGVDVLDGWLFVAYNAGLQVWDISPPHAADPRLITWRDGWMGHFLQFRGQPTEDHSFLEEVAVFRESPTTILVAASGRVPEVGFSLWRFDTVTRLLLPIYQDPDNHSFQVRLVRHADRFLALSARPDGVRVYDVDRASALGSCLELTSTSFEDCPGVRLGFVGDMERGRFVDALAKEGRLMVSASDAVDGSEVRVDLWRLDDPSSPETAVRLARGLESKSNGNALFEHDDHLYLATVHGEGAANRLSVFAIDACLAGPCDYGPELAGFPLLPFSAPQYLSFSRSDGDPFLYYGGAFNNLSGASVEKLLDLRPLRPDHVGIELPELGSGGPTQVDGCSGAQVGFWSWYYPGNESGLRNLSPRRGRFHGEYFYRAALGVLDVHRRTGVESSPGIFSGGFESGGLERWSAAQE